MTSISMLRTQYQLDPVAGTVVLPAVAGADRYAATSALDMKPSEYVDFLVSHNARIYDLAQAYKWDVAPTFLPLPTAVDDDAAASSPQGPLAVDANKPARAYIAGTHLALRLRHTLATYNKIFVQTEANLLFQSGAMRFGNNRFLTQIGVQDDRVVTQEHSFKLTPERMNALVAELLLAHGPELATSAVFQNFVVHIYADSLGQIPNGIQPEVRIREQGAYEKWQSDYAGDFHFVERASGSSREKIPVTLFCRRKQGVETMYLVLRPGLQHQAAAFPLTGRYLQMGLDLMTDPVSDIEPFKGQIDHDAS